jgi:Tol biopolymer transport system component
VPDKAKPDDSQALYLFSLQGGETRRLTSPPPGTAGDLDPSVSPDGRSIAFVREKNFNVSDICVLRWNDDLTPAGEPLRVVLDGRFIYSPAWMPEGRAIVYESGSFHNPRLWRVGLPQPGRAQTPELLAFAGSGTRSPAISRQGALAYMTFPLDADIRRLDLAGSPSDPHAPHPPVTVISSSRLDHTPQFSPDGSRIAFASDRSGSHEIWVCDRDGSNAMKLTSFGGPYTADPFWSPDGRWIAFGSRPEGGPATFIVRSSGGAPRQLTTAHLDVAVSGWSRDGNWIYLSSASPTGSLQKISPAGGKPVMVTPVGQGRAIESPDGRFLYLLKNADPVGTLWRMPLPSGEPEKILDSVYGFNFAITDAGVFFIPTASHPSLQFMRLVDRKILNIASLGSSPPVFGMSLSNDGRALLFPIRVEHPTDLMLVENFR